MSLKDEIEKIIQAERKKLEIRDQKSNEFRQRQKELFKPMVALLNEMKESFEQKYLEVKIYDDRARIKSGYLKGGLFNCQNQWTVQPNFRISVPIQIDEPLCDEPGFKVEEINRESFGIPAFEQTLTFETETDTIEYLIKEIARDVAENRHLEK